MILILLLVAACGVRTGPTRVDRFRAADAPIYSAVVVDVTRLSGLWVQAATFAAEGRAGCSAGQVEFARSDLRWDLCLPGGRMAGAGPLTPGTPGRFGVEGMADWWVLWVDADYRTLVIGTPSGAFGFVLNREPELPADRARAARDILQFNGYTTENLDFFQGQSMPDLRSRK